jgi:hypothetical protein
MATKVRHRSAAAIALVAWVALASAACGPAVEDEPAATPDPGTAPAEPGAAPAQPAAPGVPAAAGRPDEAVPPAAAAADRDWTAGRVRREHPVTGVATLRAVRTARHDAFERIVFEFEGREVPSYGIQYVDRPIRECGSGHVVELPGDAWLSIRFEPARGHDDEGRATITERDRSPGFPLLLRLRTVCDYEAHLDWVAAVSTPQPFAVMELREPARLVVDLRAR